MAKRTSRKRTSRRKEALTGLRPVVRYMIYRGTQLWDQGLSKTEALGAYRNLTMYPEDERDVYVEAYGVTMGKTKQGWPRQSRETKRRVRDVTKLFEKTLHKNKRGSRRNPEDYWTERLRLGTPQRFYVHSSGTVYGPYTRARAFSLAATYGARMYPGAVKVTEVGRDLKEKTVKVVANRKRTSKNTRRKRTSRRSR